jgi:hypothetical protein
MFVFLVWLVIDEIIHVRFFCFVLEHVFLVFVTTELTTVILLSILLISIYPVTLFKN